MESMRLSAKKKANPIVEKARIGKAVDALLSWLSRKSEEAPPQLLEDDQFLYLLISMKNIPHKAHTNPRLVRLPHPIFSPSHAAEVCLIVNDLSRGVQKKEAKEKVLEEGLGVSKVIGVRKLQTDYKSYEAKRKLLGSYDLFLADDRILSRLPALLGKTFMKKKKHPIPVKLSRKEWKHQIERACESTYFYVGAGTSSAIRVARISQKKEEIVNNIAAVIEGAAEAVPKNWNNIAAIYLKSVDSTALPLYLALPDAPLKIESGLQKSVTEASQVDDLQDSHKTPKKKGRKRYIDTE